MKREVTKVLFCNEPYMNKTLLHEELIASSLPTDPLQKKGPSEPNNQVIQNGMFR